MCKILIVWPSFELSTSIIRRVVLIVCTRRYHKKQEINGTNNANSVEDTNEKKENSSTETEDQVKLCQKIEGIWHTAIVVYGRETFYGSQGITTCEPGGTILGQPLRIIPLGKTYIPRAVFDDYIHCLGRSTFRGKNYDLLKHNCNNFSNELSQFLVGQPIPQYILSLPENILSLLGSSFRQTVDGLVSGISASVQRVSRPDSPDFLQLASAIEQVRRTSHALEERRNEINEKIAKRERKKNKKKRKEGKNTSESSAAGCQSSETKSKKTNKKVNMAESVEVIPNAENGGGGRLPSEAVEDLEAEERREREEKKRQRDPPVVFREAVDIRIEFDALVGMIDGKLSPEEMQSLEELHQYMLEDEGSWALGDSFLAFIGRLLHDRNLPDEVPVKTLNVLACAALKDDVILLLHQDRREHIIMNYAHDVDRLPLEQQKALALFMCNLFENLSSSEWMLYISEWQFCNQNISNIRVTTKVAVNSLLSDNADLKDRGSAIVHNLACKEKMHQNKNLRRLLPAGSISKVFDDVAVELTMAILQFFNSNPPEEQLFRCMKALARFCQISSQDVPQLIQMIGPEPANFKGRSERVDNYITEISKKLR
ncbi:uncharacterized protein LOC142330480 isoform X3 [Lycorma delicatula]|uniref:uncharacterized protein LOC142330480 isoform X3 n=1 Tax=Lycorma delicatula TaxID=130591 RepID=UPI003F5112D6